MKKKIIFTIILFGIGALLGMCAAWLVYRSGGLEKIVVDRLTTSLVAPGSDTVFVRRALGYEGKRTYLLLFLNNTELRPSGGFIGAYGIVTVENGKPTIEKIEGTEILDNATINLSKSIPPEPLSRYIKIKKWQLRDSNWSPDFPTAAKEAMAKYMEERGYAATEIDGVIGFTPTLMERLLEITGPITVGNETFSSTNATEQLEYAVEYGYGERGYSRSERKQTLTNLVHAVADRMKTDIFRHWSEYLSLVPTLLREKQIMLYSLHPEEQTAIITHGYGAEMQSPKADYLLWADANLGALKTDASITRNISYSIAPTSSGYIATVTMTYTHTGSFNWRTTRYLDYARIFVPAGSTLISSEGVMQGGVKRWEDTQQGVENGYAWFGGFTAIEPGKTGTVRFVYRLAPTVVEAIRKGSYHLLVQKQSGTIAPGLTLGLEFGTKLTAAKPSEEAVHYGDTRYDLQTDLRVDRVFEIGL